MRSVSAQTGISPHALRNWERRYGVVRPERDRRGRRVYSTEEVERLKALADATRQGHRIGDLVGLPTDAVRLLVASARAPGWRLQAEAIVARLLDAVRGSSPQKCRQVLELADAVLIPDHLVEHVFSPVLRQIGDCWEHDDLAIVQEHMFSELARQSLLARIHRFNDVSQGPVVVFATFAGESHVLGALMAALVCATRGYRVVSFGDGLPPVEIARGANETGAHAVGISLPIARNEDAGQLAQLSASLNPGIGIWLGGDGCADLTEESLPPGGEVFARASEIHPVLEGMVTMRPPRRHSG